MLLFRIRIILHLSLLKYLLIPLFIFLASGFSSPTQEGAHPVVDRITQEFSTFAARCQTLASAIDSIDGDKPETIECAKALLKECRYQYKTFSYFLEYYFPYAAVTYNSPAKIEVEEPDLEFNEPSGLQMIEALLFEGGVGQGKVELQQHAKLLYSSARDLHSLLYRMSVDDKGLMESVRLGLVSVISLTVAGFDAPFLKSGIQEAYYSLSAMEFAMRSVAARDARTQDSISLYFGEANRYLIAHGDFDSFDRLTFFTDYALPLQEYVNRFITESHLELNSAASALDYSAKNIFSRGAINPAAFSPGRSAAGKEVIDLGRRLFFERRLSGDGSRSCATCHDPGKYFSDGLAKSVAFDRQSRVKRNAPTLLYAALQQNQFWDGRVKTLEEQIADVILSADEMNGSRHLIDKGVGSDPTYGALFERAFPSKGDSAVSLETVGQSIAAFLRTLAPRDSPFDRYMLGDKSAMSAAQKNGFNLFMGKAMCGTCHFAPLFNGLLPPLYRVSEVEVLGVPQTEDFRNPQADTDEGRFNVLGISFHKGAFKTPTVRNVGMTAPYMHNGSQTSLEKVIDFYNQGGGAGLGMSIANQTLPAMQLNLTAEESGELIEFLNALTDPKEAVARTLRQH